MDEALSGPFAVIMEALPSLKTEKEQAVAKIQALFRGEESRRCMKYRRLSAEHRDRLKSLRACSGLLLGGHHPILLSVKPNSAGMIKGLRYFDVSKNSKGWIRFSTPFILPQVVGDYALKLYSSLMVPSDATDVSTSVHMVAIKYVDDATGHYFLRQVQLLLDDDDNIRIHMDSIDMRSRTPKLATLPESQFESFETSSEVDDAEGVSFQRAPSQNAEASLANNESINESIDKGSYRHAGTLYLYNISDAAPVAQRPYDCKVIDLLLVNSGQKYKYFLPSYMVRDIPVLAVIRRLIMILNVIPTPFDPTDASAENSIVSIGSASLGSGAWSGATGSYRCGIVFCERHFLVHFVVAEDVQVSLIDTQLRPLLIDGDEKKDIVAAKQTEAFDFLYQRAMESFEAGSIVDETKLVAGYEEFDGSSIASEEVLGDQLPEDELSTARSLGEAIAPVHEEAVSLMPEGVGELMRSSDKIPNEVTMKEAEDVYVDSQPDIPTPDPKVAAEGNEDKSSTPESTTGKLESEPAAVEDVVNAREAGQIAAVQELQEPSTQPEPPADSSPTLESRTGKSSSEAAVASNVEKEPIVEQSPDPEPSMESVTNSKAAPETSPLDHITPAPSSSRSVGDKSVKSARSQKSSHSLKSSDSGKKSKASLKSQKSVTKMATPKTSARSVQSQKSHEKPAGELSHIAAVSRVVTDAEVLPQPLKRGDSYVSPTKSEAESAALSPPARTPSPPISALPLKDILPPDVVPAQEGEDGDVADDLSALTPTSLERRSGNDATDQYTHSTDDDEALQRMETNVTEVYYTGQVDSSPREYALENLSPLLGTGIPYSPLQSHHKDKAAAGLHDDVSQEISQEEEEAPVLSDISPRHQDEEASGDIFAQEPTGSPSKYNNLEFIRAGVKININPANFDSGMWERCNSQQVTHVQSGVKVQAAYFLEVQTRRLEAVEYLCGRANRALYVFDRRDAFNYLKTKAQEVLRIMELEDLVMNANTSTESENRQSESEQVTSIPVQPVANERHIKSKKRPRKVQPHHKSQETPKDDEVIYTVDDIVRSSTPSSNPKDLVTTLRALSPSRTRRLEPLSSFQESALDTLRTRSRGGLAPLSVDTSHAARKLSTGSYTNPVDFVSNIANTEAVFERSLADYKKYGYVNGTCRYVQVWKVKLRNCLHLYDTPEQLDKAIYLLQKSVPEMSKEAAFCALAETEGSAGEAVGKLRDTSFRDEVKLICHALPISQIIRIISEYKDRNKTQHNIDIMESVQYSDLMRSDTFPDLEPSYVFSPDVSRSLPHLGLDMSNHSVRLRGNVITRKDRTESKSVGNSPMHSPVNNAEQLRLPNIFKSGNNSNEPSPKAATQPLPVPAPLVKSHSTSDFGVTRNPEKKSMMSKTAATQPTGGLDPTFKRVDQLIDELSREKTSMIVLSRRDALRAEEESLLTKYYGEKSPFRKRRKRRDA